MRGNSVQVEVPASLYNEFLNDYNENISTGQKRKEYHEADFHNTAIDQHIADEALIPYFLEELGYSSDAEIGPHGQIEDTNS